MIEAEQRPAIETPHVQEMLDEANRVGASGDFIGKAQLLTQAGYSGSPQAFYDLARMYLDGSLPKDMPLAVKYVTQAHDAGYSEATRVLGMLYLRGQGVPADEKYGRQLMELASKHSSRAAREYGQLLADQAAPELHDLELGINYLRDAADRGDSDAAVALSKALADAGRPPDPKSVTDLAIDAPDPQRHQQIPASLKDRALRGDTTAMVSYGQQLMLRKVPSADPEFTAYCWFSAAEKLGSQEARNELKLISGVRVLSDKKSPGRLDQCISDLQYQIRG
jgi:TPR repeat protein